MPSTPKKIRVGRITLSMTREIIPIISGLADRLDTKLLSEVNEHSFRCISGTISNKFGHLITQINPIPGTDEMSRYDDRRGWNDPTGDNTLISKPIIWKRQIWFAECDFELEQVCLNDTWCNPTSEIHYDRDCPGTEVWEQTAEEFRNAVWHLRLAAAGLEEYLGMKDSRTTMGEWEQQHPSPCETH